MVRIALKSGVGVERINKNALVLSDGSEIPADVIIYATGFGSMEQWVKRLISPEVADKIGPCWGYGSAPLAIPDHGKAKFATCGNRLHKTAFGFMAEICSNRAFIPTIWDCS